MSLRLEKEHEQKQVRLEKLQKIRMLGIDPYPARFERTHKMKVILEAYVSLEKGIMTDDVVSVAGRVMSIRNSGMFIDLHDDSGKIQVYVDLKNLDDVRSELLDSLDIGDFIGVTGIIRRTPRGELTVNMRELNMLSKALLPLPDQYYGLNDVEIRYRQRYLDLIINSKSLEILVNRSKIIAMMRSVLTDLGFLEVETPMLHPIAGGAIAKPFVTHHNSLDTNLFLRIAPELYLKKLIVGGLSEKIFEINRCFRNEGISTRHNPEFTSLELYQAYSDYNSMIEIVELVVKSLCASLHGSEELIFANTKIDFSGFWPRKSMLKLIEEETKVDFLKITDVDQAREKARSLGVQIKGDENWGKVVEAVFGEKVEHLLIQPVHVTDLPTDISPLSKSRVDEPRLTERFETYIYGWEIANGFSELNDPVEQRARFMQQVKSKESGDDEAHDMDEDFLTALEHAMPPTGGLGIGIDRLVMILTNSQSIREVIAFPTLKPKP